ncbi:hypothetical protein HII31_02687 [Pseudocercospora fuligena]|uniref:Mid2 domain-containing protein n=1 Tax=Pseudocercospora fuligena TaxID=685502 RepID=A0A8H6RRY9_9PEZI|nr:hypothetical protein HII31_02687 [Pseudocercospora fuligena]
MLSKNIFAVALLLDFHIASGLWIPKELENDVSFWQPEAFTPFAKRDEQTCGGVPGLSQCGTGFPSSFCCGANSKCLLLNTTSTITAALCCPAGQDCQTINTVSCDKGLQNATATPSSELHSDPPTQLETCGNACCPMGYKCQGGNCIALTASEVTSSTQSISSLLPTSTASISVSVPSTTAPASEAASTPADLIDSKQSSNSFSGGSFAAGFVPGIVIGLVAAALIIYCILKKRKNGSYVDDKHRSSGRDTLTDLSPDLYRRPTVHGRSISEPAVDTSAVHRTDFLNYSPPSQKSIRLDGATGYVVEVTSPPREPVSPQEPTRQKGWFSRSPFVNQVSTPKPTHSPIPSHLKRGTLSFKVSPVRGLKKQRSIHSLRRQADDRDARRPDSLARSQSTETIKVAMATPDQHAPQLPPTSFGRTPEEMLARNLRPQNPEPLTSRSWQTMTSGVSSEESTPIDEEPGHNYQTPTRPGRNSNVAKIGATLQSPYTPSNYGPSQPLPLKVNKHDFLSVDPNAGKAWSNRLSSIFPDRDRDSTWRDTRMTTWGSIMNKAGLTKSKLYDNENAGGKFVTKGGDPREWNRRS